MQVGVRNQKTRCLLLCSVATFDGCLLHRFFTSALNDYAYLFRKMEAEELVPPYFEECDRFVLVSEMC